MLLGAVIWIRAARVPAPLYTYEDRKFKHINALYNELEQDRARLLRAKI